MYRLATRQKPLWFLSSRSYLISDNNNKLYLYHVHAKKDACKDIRVNSKQLYK